MEEGGIEEESDSGKSDAGQVITNRHLHRLRIINDDGTYLCGFRGESLSCANCT